MVSYFALHVDVRHRLLDDAERTHKEFRIKHMAEKKEGHGRKEGGLQKSKRSLTKWWRMEHSLPF
jgi:hypothetical protein